MSLDMERSALFKDEIILARAVKVIRRFERAAEEMSEQVWLDGMMPETQEQRQDIRKIGFENGISELSAEYLLVKTIIPAYKKALRENEWKRQYFAGNWLAVLPEQSFFISQDGTFALDSMHEKVDGRFSERVDCELGWHPGLVIQDAFVKMDQTGVKFLMSFSEIEPSRFEKAIGIAWRDDEICSVSDKDGECMIVNDREFWKKMAAEAETGFDDIGAGIDFTGRLVDHMANIVKFLRDTYPGRLVYVLPPMPKDDGSWLSTGRYLFVTMLQQMVLPETGSVILEFGHGPITEFDCPYCGEGKMIIEGMNARCPGCGNEGDRFSLMACSISRIGELVISKRCYDRLIDAIEELEEEDD